MICTKHTNKTARWAWSDIHYQPVAIKLAGRSGAAWTDLATTEFDNTPKCESDGPASWSERQVSNILGNVPSGICRMDGGGLCQGHSFQWPRIPWLMIMYFFNDCANLTADSVCSRIDVLSDLLCLVFMQILHMTVYMYVCSKWNTNLITLIHDDGNLLQRVFLFV